MDASGPRSTRQKHILLVEDEPVVCELLHTVLVESGYSVTVARTVTQALPLLQPPVPVLEKPVNPIDVVQLLASWFPANARRRQSSGDA